MSDDQKLGRAKLFGGLAVAALLVGAPLLAWQFGTTGFILLGLAVVGLLIWRLT